MDDWVALRLILEVCDRETGYEGGGRRRETWWQERADRKQLIETLEEILVAARAQRRESGRHGEVGEGGEVADYYLGIKGTWYVGTETGDSQVGYLSCVGTRRPAMDVGKGHDQVVPPRLTLGGGSKWRIRNNKHS